MNAGERISLVCGLAAAIAFSCGLQAQGADANDARALDAGIALRIGEQPLEVDGFAAPTLADWNGNGNRDLVVGQFDEGRIAVFLNMGSDAEPLFDSAFFVRSAGKDIATSFD